MKRLKCCFTDLAKYKFSHFPLLELDDGNHIFSSDAIIKYILPHEQPLELRDQVIETNPLKRNNRT